MTQILLTGPVNSGKTAACKKLLDMASGAGLKVGGIITEKIAGEKGDMEFLILRDLTSGDICHLARLAGDKNPPEGWFREGRWNFHQEAFAWGNILLSRPKPIDLMVIDEVGPLEMEGGGFAPAVWTARAPKMVYVVRSSLARELRAMFARGNLQLVELTEENRDDIPRKLCDMLGIEA